MTYYYYKIQNKINNNLYIGITTDWVARKNRHFNKLKQNEHFNPHLQAAFNKYGEESFFFKIIEKKEFDNPEEAYQYEADLIKKFDTYNNGYNCNPGGQWTGPRGRFTKEEVFYIKSACYYNEMVTGVLSRFFNCPISTIENIRYNKNYKPWCQEFDKLEEKDKNQIYEDFCTLSNFEILKLSKNAKRRNLNKEQVFIILYCDETHFTTFAELRRLFKVKGDHRYTFQEIRSGKTYKDYYAEYKQLTKEEKEKLCTYVEKYK